jgi:DinB superfamily/Pentapeptide repeats (8 copies)
MTTGGQDISTTDAFRGARFTESDLTGATFRDCDLRQVKICDSWLIDVNVSGLVENFVVNDVDVTAFVEAELDRRHPDRVQRREMQTADDYRAMWDTVERIWSDTVARVERLPEPDRHERVDDEWSFVETMRHLVFAIDAWASRTVLNEPRPYHPLGLPASGYPSETAVSIGIDVNANPSYAEVMAARADRVALVRRIVDGLTDADLTRICTQAPAPGYPEEPRTVERCLHVVMKEESEHHRYIVRDLALRERNAQG